MPSQALVDHLLDVARTAHPRGDGLLQLEFEGTVTRGGVHGHYVFRRV